MKFLEGKKTYIGATLLMVHALSGIALNLIGDPHGAELNAAFAEFVAGFTAIGLRDAIGRQFK